LSEVKVDGNLDAGGQQQFFFRNSEFESFSATGWNLVHVGNTVAPKEVCANWNGTANHVTDVTPLIAEKPYITMSNGKFTLMRPKVETNKVGNTPLWDNADEIDFS